MTADDERVGGSTLNERIRGRGWQLIESVEAGFQRGEIDAAEWHARIAAIIGPAYLSAADPRAQSGFAGSPAEWESARRFQFAAIRRDGTFLDVGCANGLLLECAVRWLAEDGVTVEPYGLEILSDLAALARQRPQRDPGWHCGVGHCDDALPAPGCAASRALHRAPDNRCRPASRPSLLILRNRLLGTQVQQVLTVCGREALVAMRHQSMEPLAPGQTLQALVSARCVAHGTASGARLITWIRPSYGEAPPLGCSIHGHASSSPAR